MSRFGRLGLKKHSMLCKTGSERVAPFPIKCLHVVLAVGRAKPDPCPPGRRLAPTEQSVSTPPRNQHLQTPSSTCLLHFVVHATTPIARRDHDSSLRLLVDPGGLCSRYVKSLFLPLPFPEAPATSSQSRPATQRNTMTSMKHSNQTGHEKRPNAQRCIAQHCNFVNENEFIY